MKHDEFNFRMDFEIEILETNEKERTFSFIAKPDPRRYEWVELNGVKHLYDKLDNVYFSPEAIQSFVQQQVGLPGYFQPPKIGNADKYIESRKPIIKEALNGKGVSGELVDKSEDFLESLSEDQLGFVIMSIDIKGSTKLSQKIEPKEYTQLITTILYEMSEIIPKFRGHVLKYTGDGLIAYFPEPSFITMHDLAIDCALTIRGLVYEAINPLLKQEDFSEIDIRIGLDSGDAYVTTVGSPETKRHRDIIGSIVSLAAKIQSKAPPGGIYLGDTTLRNLHTMWRAICEEVNITENWEYKNAQGQPYRIHRITCA